MTLCWVDGTAVQILESDGTRALLLTTRAAPPGTPLVLHGSDGVQFQFKVSRCQKQAPEPGFRIEGRWISLSRADRLNLEQLVKGNPST